MRTQGLQKEETYTVLGKHNKASEWIPELTNQIRHVQYFIKQDWGNITEEVIGYQNLTNQISYLYYFITHDWGNLTEQVIGYQN